MRRMIIFPALLMVFLVGCYGETNRNSTVMQESRQTEYNHKNLVNATPPPVFERSLERENLVRRLKTLNVQNKIMYIHCVSKTGQLVKYSPVQGKVSSLNSLLTTPEQIVTVETPNKYITEKMPSPDLDGSYGVNPNGVFWFGPDGSYNEWVGDYFLSDRPQKINTPVVLQATEKE